MKAGLALNLLYSNLLNAVARKELRDKASSHYSIQVLKRSLRCLVVKKNGWSKNLVVIRKANRKLLKKRVISTWLK